MSSSLYLEYLKSRYDIPDGWAIYKWKGVGRPSRYELTGIVPRLYTRGPRKGMPNYGGGDKTTKATYTVILTEYDAWCEQWERDNQSCMACLGIGLVVASRHIVGVTEYCVGADCPRCAGTGVAPHE